MNDLISTAILIATLFGGTVAADKIYISVRRAALHGKVDASEVSKETRQTFKGNALYDLRKIKDFIKKDLISQQGKANGVSQDLIDGIIQKIKKSTSDYEHDLEYSLENFKPTTTHGDYHGGNLFFNEKNQTTTIIDYGSVTWTMAKKNQPGTGDPANDLGRMLGHLVIEDLKSGKVGKNTSLRIQEFYTDYLSYSGLQKGTPEESILRKSITFYVNRYFAVQLSDVKGTKFNSQVYERPELIRRLFNTWNEIDHIIGEM